MSTNKVLEKNLTTCPGVVVDVGVPFLGLTVTLPPPSQLATVGHCPFSMALILCVYRMRLFYNGMNVGEQFFFIINMMKENLGEN